MPKRLAWTLALTASALMACGDESECGAPCPAGQECIVITEFSAAGQETLLDEDGLSVDWIELHNQSENRVALEGHFLTNDARSPRRWRVPVCSLEPGEFLVLFASGKNRPDHTNFELGADLSYLALIRPDGATVESEYASPPAQVPGISYGREFVDGRPTGRELYFPEATPGQPNGPGVEGIGGPVEFEPSARAFEGALNVQLEADETEIRYTRDGSIPDPSSPLYEDAIQLTETTVVRARTFQEGAAGPVRSATYYALAPEVAGFESNLPIVVLRADEPLDQGPLRPANAMIIDTTDGVARLTDAPQHASQAGMRIRGSSSFFFDKQQYNLELRDEASEDIDVPLLGMPADSDWIVHAPWSDKTLMRNHLVYGWYRDIGRYAPRTGFIELFFEAPTEESELGTQVTEMLYAGVYVLLEKIKRGDDRVDIERLSPSDNTLPELSGGYLVARDRTDEGDSGFYTPSRTLIAFSEPNENALTDAQFDYITGYFADMEEAFAADDFAERYPALVDVDSLVDHHLFVEFTRNVDGFRLSTYFVKDRDEPLAMGPIWDCNLCLGNAATFSSWKEEGWHHAPLGSELPSTWDCACGNQDTAMPLPPDQNTDCGEGCWPSWTARVFDDPAFVQRYRERWEELREGPLSDAALTASIDAAAAELEEAQVRNFERWRVLGRPLWGNTFVGATWQEEVLYMREWTLARAAWMDAQLAR